MGIMGEDKKVMYKNVFAQINSKCHSGVFCSKIMFNTWKDLKVEDDRGKPGL